MMGTMATQPITWYLATCMDCTPNLPQPFRDQGERDTWADEHKTATGHVVVETGVRQGDLESEGHYGPPDGWLGDRGV